MSIDLSKYTNYLKKQFSQNYNSKEIKAVEINNECIILKTIKKKSKYLHEKKILLLLQNETFTPQLKYYDDQHLILGLSNVGDSIAIYKKQNKEIYNCIVDYINLKIKKYVDILHVDYNLYHNDLREKNICIDDYLNVSLIDFDYTSTKLRKLEKKYLCDHFSCLYYRCSIYQR